ncbi:dihydrolipoamide acetyltransferase family protein [Dichotomicrobium thermohalophilum]|uniref:Dihydrolipoamide acetyltransferase component of pyruvate dehydrogenase complex n=1 Tax=Dichotomicrobium thermohalophilum TaxID=933063 RepID=A0A397Q5B6_9HYPH|nr:dihydrolipoamide acetyltransferase family protein [Dichotomicrobium thermohalophilum]RIA54995.1 pyruvate dehydrogenase E2 component (dihydrolipoamide acetyltransferase) [Dichotomicrobium thermohalophilum]
MAEFRMPSLGADMEAGTLVEWMVKPGDTVTRGDIVAVVETQKGAIEIEIFDSGEVEKLLVDEDTEVPVGTPLAIVRKEGETEAEARAAPEALVEPSAPPRAAAPPPAAAKAPPSAGRVRISPVARRLAHERGVDISQIKGTGPGGAIVKEDIEQAAAAQPEKPEKKRAALNLDAMREAIAAAMARSKREIPHYYLAHRIDMTACEEWLAEVNAERPPAERLLMGALNVKATALAARKHLKFNGFFEDGEFQPSDAIHVGMAIAIRGGGLAAPALRDADKQPLDELMADIRDLVARTRAGRMRSSEISDPTITVSSMGDRGVEALYGIIYPPQVAIVGFGKPETRPWIVDGAVVPRTVMTITLSADHRVTDGHAGGLFLAEIGQLLQEPEKL